MSLLAALCVPSTRVPAEPADSRAGSVFERLVARNLLVPALYPPARLDSLLSAESELGVAERIGLWARRFLADPDCEYLFGLKAGGYVAEGLLLSDRRQDCVSLLYRCGELARAMDHRDAISLALALRFPGAPLDALVDAHGRVDYDRPEHLDYSLDMIRSGLWGRNLTAALPGARTDAVGTERYPAGSFPYLPGEAIAEWLPELREGDVAWFVLSSEQESARRLRDDHGLVIGHIGIVIAEGDEPRLVHAASSDLPGEYAGGRIVQVPLSTYLGRVERFQGVMITRF